MVIDVYEELHEFPRRNFVPTVAGLDAAALDGWAVASGMAAACKQAASADTVDAALVTGVASVAQVEAAGEECCSRHSDCC